MSCNQNGMFPEASNYDKLSVPGWLKKRNVLILVNNVLHCFSSVLWGISHNQGKETDRKQLITVESDTFSSRQREVETAPNFPHSSSVLSLMCKRSLYSRQDYLKHSELYGKRLVGRHLGLGLQLFLSGQCAYRQVIWWIMELIPKFVVIDFRLIKKQFCVYKVTIQTHLKIQEPGDCVNTSFFKLLVGLITCNQARYFRAG